MATVSNLIRDEMFHQAGCSSCSVIHDADELPRDKSLLGTFLIAASHAFGSFISSPSRITELEENHTA